MVATAKKKKVNDETAAFQQQLAAMRLSPDAPNRDVARELIAGGNGGAVAKESLQPQPKAETAPVIPVVKEVPAAPAPEVAKPEPTKPIEAEPAEIIVEKPAPKPTKKPKRAAATERITVTLTPDELDVLDKLKATLKRNGVKLRNIPDAWAFRIALRTWQPGDHDLNALATEIKAADGRTRG